MSAPVCGRADEYLAGLLAPADEEAFLAHSAGCARCQADLHDGVQLAGLEAEARDAGGARVIPLGARRFRRAALVIVPALAAAAALVWVARERQRPAPPVVAAAPPVTLAATRSIEPRLTWAPADVYRRYDVVRAGPGPGAGAGAGEPIAPDAIAALARRGERHGVAAAWLLSGDRRRAAAELDLAGRSPDLDSDRAAIALLDGDPARALELADGVLRERPAHVQALWNRALALRELGAPLAAAEDFARVAELDLAWRDEAQARAGALRAGVAERRDAWFALRERGYAMVAGGAPLDAADARRFPGTTRLFFYDALRVAPDAARVEALRPLAVELDRAAGAGPVLAGWVDRAARRDLARRAPAAAAYLRLVQGEDAPGVLERARAAGDDLYLGALVLTGAAPAHAEDYGRLARATGDPWFELLALDVAAQAARDGGDPIGAEARWRAARERCAAAGPAVAYRCAVIELSLARLYKETRRHADARAAIARAAALADAIGEWGITTEALTVGAEVEYLHERWAVARALAREAALAAPDYCPTRRWERWLAAQIAILERRPDEAAAHARQAPACAADAVTWSYDELSALVDLARAGRPVMSTAEARAAIASARAHAAPGSADRAWLDYAEGRLLLDGDGAEGERLLAGALAAARAVDDELARVTVRSAATTLAVDAARRGAWDDFFARLGALGAAPGPRCVVGVAVDDERAAVAVRGADGRVAGAYQAARAALDPATLVPAPLQGALAGCETVAVHASPLVVGRPELLPPTLPWSYRVRGAASPASAAPGSVPARHLVVLDPRPPADLGLPALAPASAPVPPGALVVRGGEAHPARVLLEMEDATAIEIHAHGLTDLARSDAPLLALSPGPDGAWALTAEAVRARRLRGAPLVVLADCGVAALSGYAAWGMPTALLGAGARAVLGSPSAVGDAEAAPFFAAVLARMASGEAPAAALAAVRRDWLDRAPWVRDVMVFE